MSLKTEIPTPLQESEPESAASQSVALIGPHEATRRAVARALAESGGVSVREYLAYPTHLSDVSRVLEQNYSLVLIDMDSDESYALAIVAKIAAQGTAVMAYSTRNQPGLAARCKQAGACDFIPVPEEAVRETAAPEPGLDAKQPAWPEVERRAPKTLSVFAPDPEPAPEPGRLDVPESDFPPRPPVQFVPPPATLLPSEPEKPEHKLSPGAVALVVLAAMLVASVTSGAVLLHAPRLDNAVITAHGQPDAPTPPGSASDEPTFRQPERADAKAAIPPAVEIAAMDAQLAAPSRLAGGLRQPVAPEEASIGFVPAEIVSAASVPGAAFARQENVQVTPAPAAISAGVAAGMLIRKTEPVYPQFARDAHIGGTVVLSATISKTGMLENLHVVSGPPALVNSALDAARTWRYRPYRLNGQPVAVDTTISMVFSTENR